MGAFSKALKEAQYLQPLSQSIMNYSQKMKEEEGRKQLFGLMQNLQNQNKELFTPTDAGTTRSTWEQTPVTNAPVVNQPPMQGPQLPFNPRVLPNPNDLGDVQPKGMEPINNKPQAPEIPIEGNIQTEVLGDYKPAFNPQTNPQDYNTAKQKAFSKIFETYQKGLTNENIDPQKLNALIDMYSKTGIPQAPVIPKKETKQLGDFAYTFDQYGNQIGAPTLTKKDEGGWKFDRDASGNPIVSVVSGQQYMRKTKGNGEEELVRVPKQGEGSSHIKIDLGTKEEKWGDVADMIVETHNTTITDSKGKVLPKTPDEIKRAQEKLYYTAVGKFVPSAKVWYDNKIKKEWGRENMSQADFLEEIKQGVTPDPKTGKIELSPEAAQDALDFMAFRPEIFSDLDTKNYKAK